MLIFIAWLIIVCGNAYRIASMLDKNTPTSAILWRSLEFLAMMIVLYNL